MGCRSWVCREKHAGLVPLSVVRELAQDRLAARRPLDVVEEQRVETGVADLILLQALEDAPLEVVHIEALPAQFAIPEPATEMMCSAQPILSRASRFLAPNPCCAWSGKEPYPKFRTVTV